MAHDCPRVAALSHVMVDGSQHTENDAESRDQRPTGREEDETTRNEERRRIQFTVDRHAQMEQENHRGNVSTKVQWD